PNRRKLFAEETEQVREFAALRGELEIEAVDFLRIGDAAVDLQVRAPERGLQCACLEAAVLKCNSSAAGLQLAAVGKHEPPDIQVELHVRELPVIRRHRRFSGGSGNVRGALVGSNAREIDQR